MNEQALFCDGTARYVCPMEPKVGDRVTFWFRAAKEDEIQIRLAANEERYLMERGRTLGAFAYYRVELEAKQGIFSYYFEIQEKDKCIYYDRSGVTKERIAHYNFRLVPGFSTPDWAKGAVIYQIYTDRFYNGDPGNDVESREYFYIGDYSSKVTDWKKYPATMGVREFYGGDLQGVIDKLDYLEELGVEVLYFNPLFVSPSNHKYDIQDYDYIDPHFGKIVDDSGDLLNPGDQENKHATRYQKRTTSFANLEASNALFIELVEKAHERGIKVILDGVFNHCGSFNKWMDRERIYEGVNGYEPGAYVSKDSPYHDYFHFFAEDEKAWPYNGAYEGWWGHDTLPKLNYEESIKLENYILRIGRKWVSPPYNADGWRLDVAADLGKSNQYNHQFWKKFREVVKNANPNAIILAEHYGDPREWLEGNEWDTVMNYDAFMEPITWFLTGMEKHSDEMREELEGNADNFIGAMNYHMADMLTPSLLTSMNELSNHDHSRFLTRTNHIVGRVGTLGPEAANTFVNPAVMREAVAFQMTWIGAPTVYYGDEAGVCGFTDPDNRRTYPWGQEDQEMLNFHKEMIRIHRNREVLRTGALIILHGEKDILSFARFTEKEQVVVILNNGSELSEITVPVWKAEVPMKATMKRLMYSYKDGFTTEYEKYLVRDGELVVNMGAHSALVIETTDEMEAEIF